MNRFDIVVLLVFGASCLMGVLRGATREVVTVAAFFLALAAAVLGLHLTGPIVEHLIHIHWLARVAAALFTFVAVYLVVRIAGSTLVQGVRQTALSGLDRGAGLALGAVRAWVAVGLLAIGLQAITPARETPAWVTDSKTYPIASAAAGTLRAIAPKGLRLAKDAAPAVGDAVSDDAPRSRGAT